MSLTPKQRSAVEELARRRLFEKYRYYVPNGKVEQFINLVGDNNTFINLFSAANGVGKTAAGVNILAHFMYPIGNPYFKHPFFTHFPFPKSGRIICPHTTVEATTIPAIKEWFPQDRYSSEKRGKNYDYHWITDTGYDFDIMTTDQDPKEFESATLGWAWFDEPCSEAIYKATVARMRKGGIIIFTATPLTGSAWIYDQIFTNPQQGQRDYIEADVEANCRQHGVRGILEHENIEKMVTEYSDEDKQARIFGKFQHLTGLVYKKFNRKIHVIKPFKVTLNDFIVVQRYDCHPRNPDAVGWYAIDRKGRMFVIDEIYENCPIDELAYRIKNKDSNYRVVDWRIDPSAFIVDQHTSTSVAKKMEEFGLTYLPATKDRTQAIIATRDMIDYEINNGVYTKEPMIYFFDTCIRHIYEAEHWQYNEYTGKAADRHGQSERPQDKDDHMMENLGRACLDKMAFIEPPRVYGLQQRSVGSMPVLDPYS
jgi:phage terminase large subunit-like protein